MALIKCPECNKEISDKSKVCIYCGYPLEDDNKPNTLCNINGKVYDLGFMINPTDMSKIDILTEFKAITGCSLGEAMRVVNNIVETQAIPSNLYIEIQAQQANTPKCPICNSTKLSKISSAKKAEKIGLFGIFGAGDIGKTYKCNNCGSKF